MNMATLFRSVRQAQEQVRDEQAKLTRRQGELEAKLDELRKLEASREDQIGEVRAAVAAEQESLRRVVVSQLLGGPIGSPPAGATVGIRPGAFNMTSFARSLGSALSPAPGAGRERMLGILLAEGIGDAVVQELAEMDDARFGAPAAETQKKIAEVERELREVERGLRELAGAED
jgi:hypothetical protein